MALKLRVMRIIGRIKRTIGSLKRIIGKDLENRKKFYQCLVMDAFTLFGATIPRIVEQNS